MKFITRRTFLKTVAVLGVVLLAGLAAPVHGQTTGLTVPVHGQKAENKGGPVYVWSGSEDLGGNVPLTFHFTLSSGSVVRFAARGKIQGVYVQPPFRKTNVYICIIIPGQAVYDGTYDSTGMTMYGTAWDNTRTWTWSVKLQKSP